MTLSGQALRAFLGAHPATIVAELSAVRGSSPRETGAFMLISAAGQIGTIGGGALEYMVIDRARQVLRQRLAFGLAAGLLPHFVRPTIGDTAALAELTGLTVLGSVSAIRSSWDFGLALVALTALMFWRVPPWAVVILCGIAGWIIGMIH